MDIEDIEVFIGTGRRQDGPLGHDPEPGWAEGPRHRPTQRRGPAACGLPAPIRKGQVLVVVNQPATIGALAVAAAQDMGVSPRGLTRSDTCGCVT